MQPKLEKALAILGGGFDAVAELAEAYRNPKNSPSMALMVDLSLIHI